MRSSQGKPSSSSSTILGSTAALTVGVLVTVGETVTGVIMAATSGVAGTFGTATSATAAIVLTTGAKSSPPISTDRIVN